MPRDEWEVKIRRMTPEDLPQVLSIDSMLVGKQRVATWQEKVEILWFVERPVLNFVAEVRDKVVGFILGDVRGAAYGTPMCGWIDVIGVHPAWQRKGIGRRLIEAFCQWCQSNQVRARIIIRHDDKRLHNFLASVGFKRGELVDFER